MEKLLSLETVLVAAAVAIGIWILYPFSTALLLAGITAYILYPLVNQLRKWFKVYDIALLLALAAIIGPVVVFLNYVAGDINPLLNAVSGISESFEQIFKGVTAFAAKYGLENYVENIPRLIANLEAYAKAQVRGIIPNLPHIAISIAVYLLATYYLLKDGAKIGALLTNYSKSLPKRDGEAFVNLVEGLKNSFDVLFFSYVTLSLIIMGLAWLGYYILGVPFAGIFALVTGLFAFLPLVGVWVGYGFTGLYYYTTVGDVWMTLAIIIYGVVVLSFLPEFILRPIFGSRVGQVHPLTILLGFFGGPVVLGAKGFLLGPILLVIAERVIKGYAEFSIASNRDKSDDLTVETKKSIIDDAKKKKK